MLRNKVLSLAIVVAIAIVGVMPVSAVENIVEQTQVAVQNAPPADEPEWQYGEKCIATEANKAMFKYHYGADAYRIWYEESKRNPKCQGWAAVGSYEGIGQAYTWVDWGCYLGKDQYGFEPFVQPDEKTRASFIAVWAPQGIDPAARWKYENRCPGAPQVGPPL